LGFFGSTILQTKLLGNYQLTLPGDQTRSYKPLKREADRNWDTRDEDITFAAEIESKENRFAYFFCLTLI